MKGKLQRIFLLYMAVVIGFGAFAGGKQETPKAQPEKPFTLRLSHAGPASDINDDYVGATALKSYIEEKSGGRVKVEIYPGSQLGNYQENMEQMNNNVLESAHTSIAAVTPFIPELSVIDLQYLVPNDAVIDKLMAGAFFQKIMGEAIREKLPNVILASVCDGGRWRSFFTTKKLIKTAEDLKGMKIRTINSPIQIEFVKFLGGAPAPVAWGELYTALATGVVEGTKNATPDIISNKFHEHIKFGTLDRHTFLYGFYFVSDKWLKSLPQNLQPVVMEGFKHAAQKQTEFNRNQESKANEEFKKAGGTLYEPTAQEKATFMGARKAMVDWYVAKYGDKWLKTYLNAVEEAKKAAGYKE